MGIEKVDTLVVGGGQAGLAMSEHLSSCGVPHLVLERDRIAESWRSRRWDSLVANGPAWHDRFPGMEFSDIDPDAFASKESVADYFVAYAQKIAAPIRCGVEVRDVRKHAGRLGFRVETNRRRDRGKYCGRCHRTFPAACRPACRSRRSRLMQLHSIAYRNPGQLPDGAVLVVGAGSSGVQIADELMRSGRQVYLSVGPHDRPPRGYRGRDFCWWLGVLGKWDVATLDPATAHVTISVSGAHGGHTVDFRRLAERGMALVGMTQTFRDGVMHFAPDLADNIAMGDANYLSMLDEADAYIARNGVDLPKSPKPGKFPPTRTV